MQKTLIGAHMSITGGIFKSIKRGADIGCNAIQIFTKNNNRWQGKEISEKDVEKFLAEKEKYGIKSVISHDSYLINLASPKDELWEKSILSFIEELQNCEKLQIPYLVMHPGSYTKDSTEKAGLERIITAFHKIMEAFDGLNTKVLLETTAGQGTSIGYRFEHLAEIIEGMGKYKVQFGVCLDTCHIFAAGYDMRDIKSYEKTFSEFDKIIGLDNLKAFHVNDTKKDLGSKVDRHEYIGQGQIGEKAFELLMNDERFINVPKILETPDDGNNVQHKENLEKLLSLMK